MLCGILRKKIRGFNLIGPLVMTKFVTCEYSHASYLKYGSEHEANNAFNSYMHSQGEEVGKTVL